MKRHLLTGLLVAWIAVGCGGPPVDDVITATLYAPTGGSVQNKTLTVPKRRALAFVAQPMNGAETLKETIDLRPLDPSICSVELTEEMNQFVLIGLEQGSTTLEVVDEAGRTTNVTMSVTVEAP